ncbi:regulatory protein RecX [Candidatus Peregrinibacteria bacterium]|nr:regulatory protein RecX [Candidatus Peregrinibacteria bacterium]
MKDTPAKKLLDYAVRLLARRNYHSVQLQKKLSQKGIGSEEEIEQTISKLREYKYINDEAFIEYYIKDQLTLRPQGTRKVRTKLFEKGIHGDTVEKELAKYESTELERAKKALKKKEALLQEESPFKRKEKLFRFLISRGFTISITREALTNFSSYSHDE